MARFYEATVEGRSLRSSGGGGGGGGQADGEEDEDSDGEGNGNADGNGEGEEESDEGREYSWKKTIMIGPSFQVNTARNTIIIGDKCTVGSPLTS